MNTTQATPAHPLQKMAEHGAKPMEKQVALRTGNSDQITGSIWAQSAIALCMGQAMDWARLAHQLFDMNIEQREAAINTWSKWKADKTKAFKEGNEPSPKMDEKAFKRIMGTATTRLSQMRGIAQAITNGMDRDAVAHHYNIDGEISGLSVDSLYDLSLNYRKAKNGRTPDTFLVALGKWLDGQAKKPLEGEDLVHYNKVAELFNSLQPSIDKII